MTTLCRSDWIEAFGNRELQLARIDPLNLPTTSVQKMAETTFGFRALEDARHQGNKHSSYHYSKAVSVNSFHLE
jgi:hypothetical protein